MIRTVSLISSALIIPVLLFALSFHYRIQATDAEFESALDEIDCVNFLQECDPSAEECSSQV